MSPFHIALSMIRSMAWRFVKQWVRQSFPTVKTISTHALADWLASEKPSPVLVDVRTAEEYALSHLPGAIHARTKSDIEEKGLSLENPIVVYCSIGYRSARLAEALQSAGYRVMNLEGSIFEWANEGRSLITQGTNSEQPTQKVHPYNAAWGILLNPICRNAS